MTVPGSAARLARAGYPAQLGAGVTPHRVAASTERDAGRGDEMKGAGRFAGTDAVDRFAERFPEEIRPRLNPNWLQNQQAHEERVRAATNAEPSPPSDEVRAVMERMASGECREEVERLVGDMLDQTPVELFDVDPTARDAVHRAAAENVVDPGSAAAEAALDQVESRYLRRFGPEGLSSKAGPRSPMTAPAGALSWLTSSTGWRTTPG